jgi:hypothetical protein
LRISYQYHNVGVGSGPKGLDRPVALDVARLHRNRVRLVQSCEVLIQLILGQVDVSRWYRGYQIGDWLLARWRCRREVRLGLSRLPLVGVCGDGTVLLSGKLGDGRIHLILAPPVG